ncbi:UDP-N-acetylmuramoyl-L-alanyl-D-glutamate--2,6-diaminopimelate ligase [Corynebacterium sp. P7202]|uniref:UDP-N-acetylmuramoyl-L-alanyl-D-glutamate--2,6-diaminopimelate ligase n=1 Tax=Corynebacterium pygosceleis TaxID=2800406 RepID=A0A9Q4C6K5_9CORY|nr:UDP-N-acetylmuramoyl-L-alanyl-D-glutamate--2,6-diaminopimelate ligase [Corynebacterium pygosceleis]MCK7636644.1 UDP-N-acetylmuramoyl-L-alanyl-D-glutamate--2,6-diaminopimelate ligase [Corynebacterium pygosceleis]MCX7467397.1 UDP-N-acetylmuramoyl-L-alanyl-D-glutamate--2,6-diaminopimelate ligase [Corynebacterium pygosceleis]
MAITLDTIAELSGGSLNQDAAGSVRISAVGINAQELPEGGLFAAVPGTRAHGAGYARESVAAAILTDAEGERILQDRHEKRPVIVVDDVREVLGTVASAVHGHPSRDMTLFGVTGTSGKTTTSYLLEAGLLAAGHRVGVIGTNGTRINGEPVPTQLTTPEAPVLQEIFDRMRSEGVTHVVMEVSSHAIALGRIVGTEFDVAGFTNLSQDHLDFHDTMEDYFATKARFFRPGSTIRARRSVICVDDDHGQKLSRLAGPAAVTVSTGSRPASVTVGEPEVGAAGTQRFPVRIDDRDIICEVPLPGRFNVANAALALTMAVAAGEDAKTIAAGMAGVVVPGRMQNIDRGQDFLAVVDYAHKPAAVSAVLKTLRSQTEGRVGIVIGAGGDRDSAKRPLMGSAAARAADLVIVTDDNPRSEDPAEIRKAVLRGAREAVRERKSAGKKKRLADIREIASRDEAIREAVAWARPGDAVIIAGKGHETGQLIGDTRHPFDDEESLTRAIDARVTERPETEEPA